MTSEQQPGNRIPIVPKPPKPIERPDPLDSVPPSLTQKVLIQAEREAGKDGPAIHTRKTPSYLIKHQRATNQILDVTSAPVVSAGLADATGYPVDQSA